MFLLLVLLWGGELARWSWVKYASFASVNGGRREFLAQLLAGGAGAFGLALSGWGVWSAIRPVEVKRVAIRLDKLPEALSGLRLVQLTDKHVGLTIGADFVHDVVRKVNALEPDIVAITGDLIDGSVEDLGYAIAPLGEIRATLGTYFVTGNHEYYSGADSWLSFLRGIGIRVLRNEHVERSFAHVCETGGARRSWLGGVVDVGKRYLMYAAGHNLGVVMRKLFGVGTPRSPQAEGEADLALLLPRIRHLWQLTRAWKRVVVVLTEVAGIDAAEVRPWPFAVASAVVPVVRVQHDIEQLAVVGASAQDLAAQLRAAVHRQLVFDG